MSRRRARRSFPTQAAIIIAKECLQPEKDSIAHIAHHA
jgi:hypothetical protein